MTGTLTLDGTPPLRIRAGAAAGLTAVSDAFGNVAWAAASGTRPENYGTIGTGHDGAAINAAISAVHAGTAPGPVLLTQAYNLEQQVVLLTGVNLQGTGQGNRQVFPDTFLGGVLQPATGFPASTALVSVGTASAPTTNPCGARIQGVGFSGMTAASALISGCTGLLVTDTADVHVLDSFFANFDRTGATGTCISLASASAGNGTGFQMHNTVLSSSWQGIAGDGAGVTDLRISNNLFHSNTEGLTLGATAGGGGAQLSNNHYTYTGMPSTGWHLSLGAQSGDFMACNEYFDQGGSARVVQLATAKGIMSGCHFLATSTSTAVSLIKLSTSASQELTLASNNCNANGSSITALFQTSAHAGAPTGGIYTGNAVYGTAASLVAVLIDSASSAIAAASTSSLYVAGNCQFA